MLRTVDLIKDVEEKYVPMLKKVNITDFTKCIAQFAGIHINDVSDSSIREYLLTWAKNKYRFFELLGNKLVYDTDIKYRDDDRDSIVNAYEDLGMKFPAYAYWLEAFEEMKTNKIDTDELSYCDNERIERLFPHLSIEGSSVTYFFKKYLSAPDELVTDIGRIYENKEIEAKYTISIDPVDMMLASENPYSWNSCYRLEIDNDGIHADGCLAAILDDSSLITYIWNNEGKFNLQGNYDFKSIRYKRMRQWISVSPNWDAIHFNMIYPGKNSYPNDFRQKLRVIVENLVNEDVTWKKNETYALDCYREFEYGYGEYDNDRIYYIKDTKPKAWTVFNERIVCPDGCGDYLPGSDEADVNYNGKGFIAGNFDYDYDYYNNDDDEYDEEEEEETSTTTEITETPFHFHTNMYYTSTGNNISAREIVSYEDIKNRTNIEFNFDDDEQWNRTHPMYVTQETYDKLKEENFGFDIISFYGRPMVIVHQYEMSFATGGNGDQAE